MMSSSPTSLAFCSFEKHTLGLYDLQKGIVDSSPGVKINSTEQGCNFFILSAEITFLLRIEAWTHVREVLGTKLMISLYQCMLSGANFELIDWSRGKFKRVFTFEEVSGSKMRIILKL